MKILKYNLTMFKKVRKNSWTVPLSEAAGLRSGQSPILHPSFSGNPIISFFVIQPTNQQTNKQTDTKILIIV